MKALSSIDRDHQRLGQLATALEIYRSELARGDPRARGELSRFVRVLRAFVENGQCEKEEQVLIPWIVRHGYDYHSSVVNESCLAHRHEHYLIEVLAQAAAREAEWRSEDRRRVCDTSAALAKLELEQLRREELQLLPQIRQRFGGALLAELNRELERFDEDSMDREAQRIARELVARHVRGAPPEGSVDEPHADLPR